MYVVSQERFGDPSTWSSKNKDEYINILLMWIAESDLTYELYQNLAGKRDNLFEQEDYDEYMEKFEKLFHEDIEEIEEGGVEFYDKFYQKEKDDWLQFKENERNKKAE